MLPYLILNQLPNAYLESVFKTGDTPCGSYIDMIQTLANSTALVTNQC